MHTENQLSLCYVPTRDCVMEAEVTDFQISEHSHCKVLEEAQLSMGGQRICGVSILVAVLCLVMSYLSYTITQGCYC